MAERPPHRRPGDGSDGSGSEFDWLYGGSDDGGGSRREPRPDETRMMRTQPRQQVRPAAPAQPTRSRPTPPPVVPAPDPSRGDPGDRGRGRTRGRRRPPIGRIVLGLLVLWLVYLVVVPFLAWGKVEKVAWEPDGDRPAEQDGTTYLLVGSDSRAGLTREERRQYTTGDEQANLADTIMLLHTGSGPSVLLSIPRDSIVDIPGTGEAKINGAYSRGGPTLLTQTVEQNTGLRIDGYIQIGLGGVAKVVDAVGGIEVCPEYRMKDEDAGLNIKKGCQEVDGTQALAYSRSRKAQQNGDLDRVKHQREVVAAIGKRVLTPWTVVNPVRWWRLNNAMPDFFTFGEGMGKVGAGRWALAMSRTSGSGGKTCTMPVTDGSANRWDDDRAGPLLQAIIDDDTDQITADQCTPAGIVGAQ